MIGAFTHNETKLGRVRPAELHHRPIFLGDEPMTDAQGKPHRNYAQSLIGNRYGRLVVKERAPNGKPFRARWQCRCDCGNEKTVDGRHLKAGKIVSCGCFISEQTAAKNRTHGLAHTPEHRVWLGMKDRCLNPNGPYFHRYGGRGITVCERWRDSFEAFYADMGPRPSDDHSIDRVNNDGNYEPSNCRWVTQVVQVRNRAVTRTFELHGVTRPLAEWATICGLPIGLLESRINRGLSIEQAIAKGASRTKNKPGPRIAAFAIVWLLSGCKADCRDVVFKRAEFNSGGGAFGVVAHTIYEFEDGSKRVIPGIVQDVPAPGTPMRICQ